MIHPFRSLLLLLMIAAVLGAVMFFYPANEYTISKDVTLKKFNYTDVFAEEQVENKDITGVLDIINDLQGLDEVIEVDSLDAIKLDTIPEPIKKLEDVLKKNYRIQYPPDNKRALGSFFKALKANRDSSVVRVLHFGDSQIEGDRITSYLRKKFQSRFGGCGVGMVPVFESTEFRRTIFYERSENWVKHPFYGLDYEPKFDRHFGLLGGYFAFTDLAVNDTNVVEPMDSSLVKLDSLRSDTLLDNSNSIASLDTGWFTLKRPYKKYRQKKTFDRITLMYGPVSSEVNFELKMGGEVLHQKQLPVTSKFRTETIPFKGDFTSLNFSFTGTESPQVHGVALDCKGGVAVDNVGLRGSSGTEFTRVARSFMSQELSQMNVKLIIFQFGVNVVPGELDNYDFIEKKYFRQLTRLKALAPEANILVVGVSDMSKKIDDHYETYSNVEMIRDAQKKAAFRAGCAFWDLYEVMGGKNSMISWVNNKPALAGKDYTHFTSRGAGFVAELLYNAIIREYESSGK